MRTCQKSIQRGALRNKQEKYIETQTISIQTENSQVQDQYFISQSSQSSVSHIQKMKREFEINLEENEEITFPIKSN